MPSLVWQSVVDIGAVRALLRIGWPIAGTARAEPRCAAAGAAAVTAGAASDSPASPPTAATGQRPGRLPARARTGGATPRGLRVRRGAPSFGRTQSIPLL